ncbi:MAG TPA: nitroreductase family protein [bacterium]|nr:nitroreductase family protein [bacterium]
MEAIFTRRTIRRYKPDPVSEDDIQDLIRAAMCAPSTGRQEPWQFVIIDDRELLKEIQEGFPYGNMIEKVPVAILVCCDQSLEIHKWHGIMDCSAAVENILIAANYKKLGSAWLGVYPDDKMMELFRNLVGLPEHVIPFALVAIGHPAEEKLPKEKFDSSKIKRNKWE